MYGGWGRGDRHCGDEGGHLFFLDIAFVIRGGGVSADRGVPAFRCQGEWRGMRP